MRALIDGFKVRGTELAEKTRARGVDTLERIRVETVGWHEALETRREFLSNGAAPRWLKLGGFPVRVLARMDRVLEVFSGRVRSEIERLSKLELSAGETSAEPATPAAAKSAEDSTKATPVKKAAPKKAKKPAARKAAKKSPAAKSAKKAEPKKAPATAKAAATKAKTKRTKPKKAAAKRARTTSSTRFVMPIAGYDDLTAKQVLAELPRLTDAQCATVRAHEATHKKRKTVLAALDSRAA